MKIRFLFIALFVSASSYSMDNLENSGQLVITNFDLNTRNFTTSHVLKSTYDKVGQKLDDEFTKAKNNLFYKRFNDGIAKFSMQEHDTALKQFAFALKIAAELSNDLEIRNDVWRARRMIAQIYRQKKQYDQAEQWLNIGGNQGDVQACIDLASLLKEQKELVSVKKKAVLINE